MISQTFEYEPEPYFASRKLTLVAKPHFKVNNFETSAIEIYSMLQIGVHDDDQHLDLLLCHTNGQPNFENDCVGLFDQNRPVKAIYDKRLVDLYEQLLFNVEFYIDQSGFNATRRDFEDQLLNQFKQQLNNHNLDLDSLFSAMLNSHLVSQQGTRIVYPEAVDIFVKKYVNYFVNFENNPVLNQDNVIYDLTNNISHKIEG